MAEPIRTSISDEMLRTVVKGGEFVDSGREWMGPERPLEPAMPPEVRGRQWDYPVGYNMQQKPRPHEPVTFEQLRTLADNLDLLRLVIETRKDLACVVPFEIRPKKKDAERDSRCDEIEAFLAMPDKELNWQEWLRVVLEDLFVIDAPCIYPRQTKGGKLYALEIIDGATVVRKIDQMGRTPMPPEAAYQQVLKGLPGPLYTRDELLYKPRNRRSNRVYGFSPVEQILMTVNIAIRRQISQLQWYTEGSVPSSIMSLPETWTMTQIKEFDEWWQETLSGNTAARRRTKFVPGGVKPVDAKEGLLKDEYDEWLARVITYAFSMTNLPFVKQINRSTSETTVEQAVNEGLAPTLGWIKMLVDSVIVRWFGATDLHLVWSDTKDPDPVQQAEAQQKRSQADEVDIRSGVLDINEARVNRGLKELSPEELEERKPKLDSMLSQDQVGEGEGDDKSKSNEERAGKLEKKKPGRQVRPIDRERPAILILREFLQVRLIGYLERKGGEVAEQVVALYEDVTKAEDDNEDERVERIIASLGLHWDDLVPELSPQLGAIGREGVRAAALQLELTDGRLIDLAFTLAEEWAEERAAELVGMEWVGGQLVPNPNPVWSITETTREMLRADVKQALEEGWSNQQLTGAIRENAGFSRARAEMIARTETAFADVQGNRAFYEEAQEEIGPISWQWVTAGDDKVSYECSMNNGAVRAIGEAFPSGAFEPPQHPRCRCDVVAVVDED